MFSDSSYDFKRAWAFCINITLSTGLASPHLTMHPLKCLLLRQCKGSTFGTSWQVVLVLPLSVLTNATGTWSMPSWTLTYPWYSHPQQHEKSVGFPIIPILCHELAHQTNHMTSSKVKLIITHLCSMLGALVCFSVKDPKFVWFSLVQSWWSNYLDTPIFHSFCSHVGAAHGSIDNAQLQPSNYS